MKKSILLCFFLALGGSISYLLYNEYVVILFPETSLTTVLDKKTKPCEITLYTWTTQQTYVTEKKTLLPEQTVTKTIHHIIQIWLQAQDLQKNPPLSLESAALSEDEKLLFLSFSDYPFNKEDEIYTKLAWIQGLLKTISMYHKHIEHVYFFVHQKSLKDYELDFSHAWPITGFLE